MGPCPTGDHPDNPSPPRRRPVTLTPYRNPVDLHRHQAERFGPRPALRFKRHGLYHDLPREQYRADALACAAALVDAGVRPGDRVGLLAENRAEWLVADMGLLTAAAGNVPPHAPLTARQGAFQPGDASVSWLFVSGRAQIGRASCRGRVEISAVAVSL